MKKDKNSLKSIIQQKKFKKALHPPVYHLEAETNTLGGRLLAQSLQPVPIDPINQQKTHSKHQKNLIITKTK